mgnify:CR=1 FL=1|tara:strand:+ start:57842 stop:58852 length:1011 start_codon:yes stop_codon:yes gene_type:complete
MKHLIVIFLFSCSLLQAQKDTIHLKNKDILAGTVENYTTGVLTFSTSYSDKDFKIEYDKVTSIYIHKKTIVTLTKSRRRYGHVKTLKTGTITISTTDQIVETFNISEVIAFQEVNDDRRKRVSASIDFGYDFTKAQGKRQTTVNATVAYVGELWVTNGSLNVLNSEQDNVVDIKRTDAKADLRRLISKSWYLIGELTYLANTEQALEGRYTPNIGFGKLLASTSKLYLGLSTGIAFNFETYLDSALNKNSTETFLAANLNMYNFEDISLTTDIKVSPTISEFGRVRADYNLTLKYDLPYDFYIKTAFTMNYDNQPAISGNDYDYIFSTGFGWEFNK